MAKTDNVKIIRAEPDHVDLIAPLFDAYRQFYECPPDLEKARDYINQRLRNGESVIFLAIDQSDGDTRGLGFTQLYPTFCSVDAAKVWVLYDLFVCNDARRRGIGRQLMERARELGEETGAAWIGLETATDNLSAQALYESLGYKKDVEFHHYVLSLE